MQLYEFTGKPFFIQDIPNLPYRPYWMFDVVLDENNKLWFNPPVINAICSVDWNKETFCIEHIFSNKRFISDEIWSYALIQKKEELLFLSPYLSTDIYVYDFARQKESLIRLDKRILNNSIKIYGCIRKNDNLIFFGRCPAIIEYNIKNKKIKYHMLNTNYQNTFQSAFIGYSPYVELNDDLWIVLANSNILMRLDCTRYDISSYKVGDIEDEYHCIATDGRYFYMTTRYSYIIKWDRDNNLTVKYHFEIEESTEPYNIYFSGIIFTGNKIVIFPSFHNSCAKKVVIFDPNDKTSEYLDIDAMGYKGYLWSKCLPNGNIIAYEPGVGEFHKYDKMGRLKEKCRIKLTSNNLKTWYIELLKKSNWIFEQTMLDINCFINNFDNRKYPYTAFHKSMMKKYNCGNTIYSNVVREELLWL